MATSATYVSHIAVPARVTPRLQVVAGLIVLAALSIPLLLAEPGPLSSDESLYVSEGLNLAQGKGFTYTTGEAVHHRGPLFPALLAADFSVAGASVDSARWVPRLFALASAALVLALGWRFFGRTTGMLAAGAALVSSLLVLMSTTLFLEGVQTFFLLAMLLCLYPALKQGKPGWAALAGGALGLAMLTKESALLWLPLPFLAALLLGRAVSRPWPLLGAYAGGFLAVAGWWWPYVYAVTGQVFLLGAPSSAALWLGAGALCVAVVAAGAVIVARRGGGASPTGVCLSPQARWPVVGLFLSAWGGLFLVGLERHSTWPFPADYLTNVPDYTATVLASWARPLPIIAVAWGYVAYRAYRGSLGDRLLLLGLLLFLPFALFVANRDLHVRDVLPLVYLSYVALGRAAIDCARWIAESAAEHLTPATSTGLAALFVLSGLGWFAIVETQRFDDVRAGFDSAAVRQDNWDNPLVTRAAGWISQHVPPGTPVMSGRLYYSQLYTLTDGRYPWWQLPTVRVDFEGARLRRGPELVR
ncbi:MAG: glycosyltransferase family 39 protein, partial [Dehalococcoidia bacterium]|nr:glycosyltransferase family 39 protein [Dehalococcoidia bacterium]